MTEVAIQSVSVEEVGKRKIAGLTFGQIMLMGTALIALATAGAVGASGLTPPSLAGIKLDFVIFGVCLAGIVSSHKMGWSARDIALTALGFELALHLYQRTDLIHHLTAHHWHEARMLTNIFGLLLGFAIMAKLFEQSRMGDWLPIVLPDDWKGPAMLLGFIFVGSMFLDNIAAAMIGGVIARDVFKGKVSIGFIAAIVAISNAGGAPSVVGDTTTTMMWIAKVPATMLMPAIVGSIGAGVVILYFASKQQDAFNRIDKDPPEGFTFKKDVSLTHIFCVSLALAGVVSMNVLFDFPVVGVWIGLIIGAGILLFSGKGKMPWLEYKHILPEAVFITALVALAGLMPVKELPDASWVVTLALGAISAVFDNIPLTAIAIKQNGYDWALLAYAVGFGGSMTWFGSSAGVAICAEFKEGKNLFAWIKQGWFIPVGYVVGFFIMFGILGWNPWDIPRAG